MANAWDGLTGSALANNPDYIRSQINQGWNQRYGTDAPADQMDYWLNKATTPDVYTGGAIHQGWNPYLMDRLVNPNSAGASGVSPGTDTIIGYDQTPGGGGGTLGSLSGGVLGSPLMQGYAKPFQGTDINSILGSEAFQAANREGLNSINRMASARGDLHTGGTLKDLAGFTNSLALGAINDQFGRDLAGAGFNRDTLWGDTDRQFGRLADFTRLGLLASGQLGGYSSTYGQTPGMTPSAAPSGAGVMAPPAAGAQPATPGVTPPAGSMLDRSRRYPWVTF